MNVKFLVEYDFIKFLALNRKLLLLKYMIIRF